MANIPTNFQRSSALQYVISKGWNWKQSDDTRIELETCPYCQKTNFGHFYMIADASNKDGLHICHRCGKQGNLKGLKVEQGDVIEGVSQMFNADGGGNREVEPLPDVEVLHTALLEDEAAMEYLLVGRGFSREIIERSKIGLTRRNFKECGEVRAIVYPYFVNGNCIFVHYRTLPTMPFIESKVPKAFNSPKGWDAPLYNGEIIRDGLKELILVEGEANTIAALDKGVKNIAGVPGANFKKALWIDELDRIAPEKIYIVYDKDKVGQKAAQVLAGRIGIERCWKITLPDFEVTTEGGEIRPGKDLNEWFAFGGGTLDQWEKLKDEAVLFDVQGVSNTSSALGDLEDFINNKTSLMPTYDTPWSEVNQLVGFEDGDVIDLVAPEKIGKTTIGMNMLEHAVNKFNEDGIIICLEMTTMRLVRKWVSHVTGYCDSIPKTPEEDQLLLQELRKSIPEARQKAASRSGTLYFCYPQYKTTEDIYKLIRDCIRRYGVKWVMFDNIQRLCDTTPHPKGANRTEHLSQISKVLSQIAKDYNIKMIRILQPHRIEEGKIVSTNNVDGASQIAKDCDCMITIHRNSLSGGITQKDFADMGYLKKEESFDPKTLFTIGLTRYSGGGQVTLYFDGARSTLKDYNLAEIAAMSMKVPLATGIAQLAEACRAIGETQVTLSSEPQETQDTVNP